MRLRILTVCQPYAWALIHGPKRIENRTWSTPHVGPLLIHAGRSREWLTDVLNDGTLVPTGELRFGEILGLVWLKGCVPKEQRLAQAHARIYGDPFAEGPVLWLTSNPLALTPRRWHGQQGLGFCAYEPCEADAAAWCDWFGAINPRLWGDGSKVRAL